jgi:hypothetical protein
VKNLSPARTVGLIVGESQAGKSFVAVHLAGCLAVRKPFFGKEIMEGGGTIYVGAEASLTIGERVQAEYVGSIRSHWASQGSKGSEPTVSTLPIAVLDNIPDLANPDGQEAVIGAILAVAQEMREKFRVPLQLVVVDTMVAAFGLEDWNSAANARDAVKVLHRIGRETGAVTIGVHHHGKDKSRGATGSFVFTASTDFILTVHRSANEDGVTQRRWAALTKTRSTEPGWSCEFDLKGVAVGGDEVGDPIYCPFVDPQPDRVTERVGSSKQNKAVGVLKKSLEEVFASGDTTIRLEDKSYRAARKSALRERFDARYGGSSEEANRKAFERAVGKLTGSVIRLTEQDGAGGLDCSSRSSEMIPCTNATSSQRRRSFRSCALRRRALARYALDPTR